MSNTDNEQLTKREQGLEAISELIHVFNSEFKKIRAQYDISDISLYVTEKTIINPCLLKTETVKQTLPEFFHEYFTGLGFTKKEEWYGKLFGKDRELKVCLLKINVQDPKYVFMSIVTDDIYNEMNDRNIYQGVHVSSAQEIVFLHTNACYHRIAMKDAAEDALIHK